MSENIGWLMTSRAPCPHCCLIEVFEEEIILAGTKGAPMNHCKFSVECP
jgi:hypothetical protein